MYDLLGLAAGILLGLCFPLYIPANMTLYMGVGLLAALDSALGGVRAQLKEEFRLSIFLSGTIGNAVIAVFLTWLGERIGIPIYLAAVVVFGTRMFENFGEIRRELLTSGRKRDKIKQDIVAPGDADTP
jgi:small basic protein